MFGVWAAIPFVASLVLLGGFLGFRLWEEKAGTRIFSRTREHADEVISNVYRGLVTRDIPTEWRRMLMALFHQLSHMLVVLTVQGLRAIERPLTRLSYRMRRGVPMANGKGPSEFLKTISPTKKETTSESTSDSV
jgi:hypothetical protein